MKLETIFIIITLLAIIIAIPGVYFCIWTGSILALKITSTCIITAILGVAGANMCEENPQSPYGWEYEKED